MVWAAPSASDRKVLDVGSGGTQRRLVAGKQLIKTVIGAIFSCPEGQSWQRML